MSGSIPDFDSCLGIADYFSVPAEKVMTLAGKATLLERYDRMKEREKAVLVALKISEKDDVTAEEREIHRRLQALLNCDEATRTAAREVIYALWERNGKTKKKAS